MMAKVLVIEDNDLDRKITSDVLTHAGYSVAEAADGRAGLRLLHESRPDLVLLDVMMPELDGWSVCERVRDLSDVPIIMVTSLDREEEMVRGLDMGADDFVSKPISPAALVARVRAVLRRPRQTAGTGGELRYDDGRLRIDASEHKVEVDGTAVELTPTEFRLLAALATAPSTVHSYASLLGQVWGPEYTDDIDFLRVYVWRLRKKLRADSAGPEIIQNERGFGYRLSAPI